METVRKIFSPLGRLLFNLLTEALLGKVYVCDEHQPSYPQRFWNGI